MFLSNPFKPSGQLPPSLLPPIEQLLPAMPQFTDLPTWHSTSQQEPSANIAAVKQVPADKLSVPQLLPR